MKKLILLFAVVIAGLILLAPMVAKRSQALGGLLSFGGRITAVEYCCNGVMVSIDPPRPGTFLFAAGSRLHAYYNIFRPGPWALGTAHPGGFCQKILAFPPCTSLTPVTGTIDMVGTSGL